ncbi:MAG: hypothetical protein ABW199_06165 [Caulobacterales bacterium]
MTDTTQVSPMEAGRGAAFVVYALFLLSIPSAALFAVVGVIIAYVARDGAAPNALAHLNDQIRIFWVWAIWTLAIIVASAIAYVLTFVLIGFPILWLLAAAGFVLLVWLTVKSVFGILRLIEQRTP